ncbi:Peroxisomal membrane protein PMP34 [Frankliniella fusca]|uniref:Peroxisomal membrane protein PMP34 n=1 Tax=Frankliniella fusca TaxID=407009 RepID=A0AAE1GY70_9NEOP|nr:Peroxisomal membrane protein PMP34 [Frankliniella fusca]
MAPQKGLFSYETLVHAIAGATGSVVGMTVFYPLDTVRSRLQLEEGRKAKNTLAVMKDLIEEEGFETLYRGAVPVLQSICASNFVYFYSFHGLKSVVGSSTNQNAAKDLLLASIAGVINVLTTTPLWVVNTRLKMSGIGHGKDQKPMYRGLWDGLCKIVSTEGVSRLWSGTIPSLILVSNPAIHFMVYETLKRHILDGRKPSEISPMTFFAVGATAKAIATFITYPLQLVQTKMRHGHKYPDLRKDAGTLELTAYIIRKHGFQGLFKGMEAKVIQTILTAALMFMTYEQIVALVFKVLLRNARLAAQKK